MAQISDGRVRLRAGTLYTALDRLRADGLVAVDGEEVVEGSGGTAGWDRDAADSGAMMLTGGIDCDDGKS